MTFVLKEKEEMIEIPEGYEIVRAIVRCKDCKYWEEAGREYNPNTNSWSAVMVCDYDECPEGCGHTCWSTDADDFCSRGVKR